jgi:DNA-binding transcriptional MocR family regulator
MEFVVPERSMMAFPGLRKAEDSESLHDRLRQLETSIVPGKFFEAPRHFRLGFTVRMEDVAEGLENLGRVVREG